MGRHRHRARLFGIRQRPLGIGRRTVGRSCGGGVDRFRIKITNGTTTVYDNRMGVSEDIDNADPTAIGGGSIVIHK